MSNRRSRLFPDALPLIGLMLFPLGYFWQVTLGQGIWLTTDILRLFYPFSVELARALNEGRLPLWSPNLAAGFPLLAEGQIGALYPINVLLYKFFPAHHALSYNILLHIVWASWGMYIFARAQGIGVAGAWLAGFVFSFNGVVFGQMFHPPILFGVAWLPWLILFVARLQTTQGKTRVRWFALAALALGIQFLCGSAHIAFLNALAVAIFGVFGEWLWWHQGTLKTFVRNAFVTSGLLALGGSLAAVQLVPTSELVEFSVRGGTASKEFVTSYSLPLEYLTQFVLPFAHGEPAEGNEEYYAYFGLVPLFLALSTLIGRRNRQTIFLAAFALVALSLALGQLNPLYDVLYRLPPFNFFRVPARYLYLFVFAMAFLSATGLEAWLSARGAERVPAYGSEIAWNRLCAMMRGALVLLAFILLILGMIVLAYVQPLAFWLEVWRVLPVVLVLATIGLFVLVRTSHTTPRTFVAAILGLTIFDLASYAPPFLKTIDAITPVASVTTPRSVQWLGNAFGRVWTDDATFPSPPALRNSLFPNVALLYDKASAQIYSSLVFGRHQAYVYNMSSAMLNGLGVRYVMIPLEPRSAKKQVTPPGNLALDHTLTFAPVQVRALEIMSATEQAAHWTDGTLIAEIAIHFADGTTQVLPLRVGIETADWDYERKRVDKVIHHTRPPSARSFPAYWRAFGRPFEGYVYTARTEFALPRPLVGVSVKTLQPDAQLFIENIVLETTDKTLSLARLSHKNEFALAYMSDTVAVWENLDVMPRAFIVHTAHVVDDSAAFARMHDPHFDPRREVLLSEGIEMREVSPVRDAVKITRYQPERVELQATTDQPGYLILADAWYPGWEATLDGYATPIYRANVLFRAVRLEPGAHTIVFEYRPRSFVLGVTISIMSILMLVIMAIGLPSLRNRKPL